MALQKFSLEDLESGKVVVPGRSGSGIFSAARQIIADDLQEEGKAVGMTDLVDELQKKFTDKDRQSVYVQARAALKSNQGIELRKIRGKSWIVRTA